MGRSSTPRDLVRKLDKVPRQVENAARSIAANNATIAKTNAERAVRAATNPKAVVTNAGKLAKDAKGRRHPTGARLTVYRKPFKRGTGGSQYNVRYVVWAGGPWQLVENRARVHLITPAGLGKVRLAGPSLKRGRKPNGEGPVEPGVRTPMSVSGRQSRRGREGRARALKTPYGLKAWVGHPGHRGKKPWKHALTKTQKDISRPAARILRQALIRAL